MHLAHLAHRFLVEGVELQEVALCRAVGGAAGWRVETTTLKATCFQAVETQVLSTQGQHDGSTCTALPREDELGVNDLLEGEVLGGALGVGVQAQQQGSS